MEKTYNKIIYNGQTLIDLSVDDAIESDVAKGKKFHKSDGSSAIGTSEGGGGSEKIWGAGVDVFLGGTDSQGRYTFPAGNVQNLTFSGLKNAYNSYCFAYKFYNSKNVGKVSFPDLTNVGSQYAMEQAFAGSSVTEVDFPKLSSFANYAMRYTFKGCTSLTRAKFPALTSFSTTGLFTEIFNRGASGNGLTECAFPNLTNANGGNALQYAYGYQNFGGGYTHLFPKLTTINGASAMANLNYANTGNGVIIFDSLQLIGTTSGTAIFTSAWENSRFDTTKVVNVCFPKVTTIGYGSGYTDFKNAWKGTNNTAYVDFPSLTACVISNTTASNAHFSTCGARKIYMPKLTSFGAQGKNTFNGDSVLAELHFGMENEEAVKALTGYSNRFGAGSQCVISFDLENHITVGGTTYDRVAEDYDYENGWYSWQNGSTTIYTRKEYGNTIGDTAYTDKNGTVLGTISAIS